MVREALSRMLFVAENKCCLLCLEGAFMTGFLVGDTHRGILNIFHLLFEDDTIIFCDAD